MEIVVEKHFQLILLCLLGFCFFLHFSKTYLCVYTSMWMDRQTDRQTWLRSARWAPAYCCRSLDNTVRSSATEIREGKKAKVKPRGELNRTHHSTDKKRATSVPDRCVMESITSHTNITAPHKADIVNGNLLE